MMARRLPLVLLMAISACSDPLDDEPKGQTIPTHADLATRYAAGSGPAQGGGGSGGGMMSSANGAAGGQTVGHFHMHVVPRHEDDGISFTWPRKEPGPQVLADYAARLREALA